MVALPAFAAVEAMVNEGVSGALANAMLQLTPTGQATPCIHEVEQPDSPFADVVTKPTHSVGVWLANVEGVLSEGATVILTTSQWPQGQACRITTPVDTDATGWAVFQVNPA